MAAKPQKNEPELLKLLNTRSAWNNPPHSRPVVNGEYLRRMNAAVEAHAKANRSDPFAKNRIALHMRAGLELPSDVLDEANGRLRSGR